jgi:hypothetical protein
MSLTIEQLDGSALTENVTVILGKYLIIKYIPRQSILDSHPGLKQLISTTDLLKNVELTANIKKLVSLSKQFKELVSDNIKSRDRFIIPKSAERKNKAFKNFLYKSFNDKREKMLSKADEIKDLDRQIGFNFSELGVLFYCDDCHSYLGNSEVSLPSNCPLCDKVPNLSNGKTVSILNAPVLAYLNGLWFEDYVAKILNNNGWAARCHGKIMGASGNLFPIDILAINQAGLVMIVECKTGNVGGKDIMRLAAINGDIKNSYGVFISQKVVEGIEEVNFLKRKPDMQFVDGIEGLSDDGVFQKIIKKFNRDDCVE